jgi:protease-4
MSLDTEAVLDRRRIARRLSFWRTFAIVAVVVLLSALAAARWGGLGLSESRQIARVTIDGMITEDRNQLRMLKRIADSRNVAGVLVVVNSPGGTTTGGEALYTAMRQIAEKKPVVAQFGTVAASAAYIVGLSTDHIVARGNSITGSVGVIMQWPEVSELLGKLGIKMNEVKSGPLKAAPSPFQPMDSASQQVVEQMISDGQRWFLGLVASRRGVDTKAIPGLEQGRVFSGREAITHRLVDEIGGEPEAVQWLEQKRNVAKGLRIVDWKPQADSGWSVSRFFGRAFGAAIAEAVGEALGQMGGQTLGAFSLDGMVSVWHPAKM